MKQDFAGDMALDQTPIELRIMQGSGGKAIDASVTYRIRAAALRTE
ncbi:hypothetical protein PQR70_31335 [Paraburkholderia madseniana]